MNYVESFNLFGVEARQIPCITGGDDPTSTPIAGAEGCLYYNVDTYKLYKCTYASTENQEYEWMPVIPDDIFNGNYVHTLTFNGTLNRAANTFTPESWRFNYDYIMEWLSGYDSEQARVHFTDEDGNHGYLQVTNWSSSDSVICFGGIYGVELIRIFLYEGDNTPQVFIQEFNLS